MGNIKWEAYEPKDINWQARSRVEAWARHDRDIKIQQIQQKLVSNTTPAVFLAIVGTLLAVTIWRWF